MKKIESGGKKFCICILFTLAFILWLVIACFHLSFADNGNRITEDYQWEKLNAFKEEKALKEIETSYDYGSFGSSNYGGNSYGAYSYDSYAIDKYGAGNYGYDYYGSGNYGAANYGYDYYGSDSYGYGYASASYDYGYGSLEAAKPFDFE